MSEKVLDAVLWRRLDTPGHDFCVLSRSNSGYRIAGTANFAHQLKGCSLRYAVECESDWTTRAARVRGYIGRRCIDLEIRRSDAGSWTLNGSPQSSVVGCTDIDLSFTPATNILALRRERLRPKVAKEVLAAWLKFPQLSLAILQQTYTRLPPDRFRYTSNNGRFRAILRVRPSGLVSRYPGLWRAENLT